MTATFCRSSVMLRAFVARHAPWFTRGYINVALEAWRVYTLFKDHFPIEKTSIHFGDALVGASLGIIILVP